MKEHEPQDTINISVRGRTAVLLFGTLVIIALGGSLESVAAVFSSLF